MREGLVGRRQFILGKAVIPGEAMLQAAEGKPCIQIQPFYRTQMRSSHFGEEDEF